MAIRKFALICFLYGALSFAAYLVTSNTIAAWIIYLFLLAPFYGLCLAYILTLAISKRGSTVRLQHPPLLYSLGIFQGLAILVSPASCFGFKQGNACYSLVQTVYVNLFTEANLQQMETTVPHWWGLNTAFPILVGLHAVSIALVLVSLRFRVIPPTSVDSMDSL